MTNAGRRGLFFGKSYLFIDRFLIFTKLLQCSLQLTLCFLAFWFGKWDMDHTDSTIGKPSLDKTILRRPCSTYSINILLWTLNPKPFNNAVDVFVLSTCFQNASRTSKKWKICWKIILIPTLLVGINPAQIDSMYYPTKYNMFWIFELFQQDLPSSFTHVSMVKKVESFWMQNPDIERTPIQSCHLKHLKHLLGAKSQDDFFPDVTKGVWGDQFFVHWRHLPLTSHQKASSCHHENYARQIGSSPQGSGFKKKKKNTKPSNKHPPPKKIQDLRESNLSECHFFHDKHLSSSLLEFLLSSLFWKGSNMSNLPQDTTQRKENTPKVTYKP